MKDETTKQAHHGKKVRHLQKVFVERESLLTELFRTQHIATIYNIFVAHLLLLIFNTVIQDLQHNGSVTLGFRLIFENFTPFSTGLLVWGLMMVSTFVLYYGYSFWAKTRSYFPKKGATYKQLFDKAMFTLLIIFFMQHLVIPPWLVRTLNFPFALSMAVISEQVRLLMKTYAFIRINVPRSLSNEAKMPGEYFAVPFQKYLYFLFAPTLIFRDDYPRTKTIRYKFVAARFLEVVGTILYIGFTAERYFLPSFRDFGKVGAGLHTVQAMTAVWGNAVPATVVIICCFYCILHSWQNGVAEMLRFGDRLFYKEWWNAPEYTTFYKTWNEPVYDWLYVFIYEDLGSFLFTNKKLKGFFVIGVSAIFHEYIVTVSVGYFIPILLILYGLGGPFSTIVILPNGTLGNIWFWSSLTIGNSMFLLYLVEYYVRVNCPPIEKSPLWDFFVPRLLTCPYE